MLLVRSLGDVQDADPSAYTPPLTWWGRTWRFVLSMAISFTVWLQVAGSEWEHHRWWFFLDIALGVTAFVLAAFRRRWPLPVAVMTNVLTLVSGLSAGPALLTGVSLATRRVVGQVVLVGAIGLFAGIGFNHLQGIVMDQPWWLTYGFSLAFTIAVVASGMYIGSRRELIWSLQERAGAAEEQQELRVASARAAERERIAREMHDVLAHRISMVSMHAGALAYRTDLPPEQVRETATLIQTKAHEALTDLRQVLGVLRADGAGDAARRDRPQPTLRDLPGLVDEARTSGMDVDLDVAVDGGPPEQVGRTVYRVVQEGLTNARKHALGTRVRVRVAGSAAEGVDVWVRNPVRVGNGVDQADPGRSTPGAGLGLVGLRERTELVGGRLDVADDRDGFALHGWLPWAP